MVKRAGSTGGLDPFLSKESLLVLSRMGFGKCGKTESPLGPLRYHGIAARTRLAVAGKKTMATPEQHRHQHHKERMTIQQVNDLGEIAHEIESFTKAGRRVPNAVWEKYDRVNKRHKKHEHMTAMTAEMRSKNQQRRGARRNVHEEGEDQHLGGSNDTATPREDSESTGNPASSSSKLRSQRCPDRRRAVAPFEGGAGCTFGIGRWEESESLAGRSTQTQTAGAARSCSSSSSSWSTHERDKINKLYWELGRPPRRGADAAREHFHRYTLRHCMMFPHRSPAEVVTRLKLMFRYNALKEPNEREHWLRLTASKGFFPMADATHPAKVGKDTADGPRLPSWATTTTTAASPEAAAATSSKPELHGESSSQTKSRESSRTPIAPTRPLPGGPTAVSRPHSSQAGRDEGGFMSGELSAAAASYAAEARAASSAPCAPSRLRAIGVAAVSPFYDPTRQSSPAWGFGEPADSRPGSRGGVGGGSGSRGGGNRRGDQGGSRGGFHRKDDGSGRGATRGDDHGIDDSSRPDETELLDYTSLGPQATSHRTTSPAHAFSREGLGSENLSMFQAEKRPEPGPGSFRPNLSATSTHPGPRCQVMIGRPGARGGGGGVGGGSSSGGDSVGGAGMIIPPGPGQYLAWDSIGRQILSTRPSSPTVTFATGEWELS